MDKFRPYSHDLDPNRNSHVKLETETRMKGIKPNSHEIYEPYSHEINRNETRMKLKNETRMKLKQINTRRKPQTIETRMKFKNHTRINFEITNSHRTFWKQYSHGNYKTILA